MRRALPILALLCLASPVRADLDDPATRAGERVLETLDGVRSNLRASRYQHHRVVRERSGTYHWDCSGMVEWVLSRASRRSVEPLPDRRVLAIDFARLIERAPTDRFRRGWRRIETIREVRPGDVFAWRRPPGFRSRNTGHVGFVIEPPQRIEGWDRGYLIRVADASRYVHQDDTREWPGDGGFGHGTMVFVTDGSGRVIGYGWHGLRGRGWREAPVVFGRVGP